MSDDRGSSRPAAEPNPAPAPAMASEQGGEDGGRRRRRGRRGGRGRGGERPMAGDTSVDTSVDTSAVAVASPEAMEQYPAERAPAMRAESRPPREQFAREERSSRSERGDREGGRDREARPEGPVLPAPELEALGVRATEQLLGAMGFEARVSAHADGENVDVTVEVSQGEELLTGSKGEVRQALQHLLNLMVNRGGAMRHHLQLEVNDFWKRRQEELETMARSMADQASTTGAELQTEYLNAQERRIIHVTLRDDTRVRTYAIGDGLIKKLAVAPAGEPGDAREEED